MTDASPGRADSPARAIAGGVRLDIRVSPGAGKTGVAGLETGADGISRLKLRIAAPPVDGAANKATLAFLAKAAGRPKRDCALTKGQKNRSKTVEITGAPDAILARLQELWKEEREA